MFVVIADGYLATFAFCRFVDDDRNGRWPAVAERRDAQPARTSEQYQARTSAASGTTTRSRRPLLALVWERKILRSTERVARRTCFVRGRVRRPISVAAKQERNFADTGVKMRKA